VSTIRYTQSQKGTLREALSNHLIHLTHDLNTKYDGDPKWSDKEDGTFLVEQIGNTNNLLSQLGE